MNTAMVLELEQEGLAYLSSAKRQALHLVSEDQVDIRSISGGAVLVLPQMRSTEDYEKTIRALDTLRDTLAEEARIHELPVDEIYRRLRGHHNFKDITGKVFSYLRVIEPTMRRSNGSVVWRCECLKCGETTEVSHNNLVTGTTKSCGCLKRAAQRNIYKKLHHVDGTCVEFIERREKRSDNKTGCTGVSVHNGRYRANITFKGERYYLGTFDELEDAVAARKKAEEELHGNFLREYYSRKRVV